MARKIFFSFHYARDAWRVQNVRNSTSITKFEKTPFYVKSAWEEVKRQGDPAIQRWIDNQLAGTSVTVVLIGAETYNRRWVKYEIQKSIADKKGLLGVHISGIKNKDQTIDNLGPNPLPAGYPVYKWNKSNGAENLGNWIEKAAIAAGR